MWSVRFLLKSKPSRKMLLFLFLCLVYDVETEWWWWMRIRERLATLCLDC